MRSLCLLKRVLNLQPKAYQQNHEKAAEYERNRTSRFQLKLFNLGLNFGLTLRTNSIS
jgi:hypothetical protein